MLLASKSERGKLEREKMEQPTQMNDLCRQKLLGYAESFQELANSFDDTYLGMAKDRESILEEYRHQESKRVICDNLSQMAQIMERVATKELEYWPMEPRYCRLVTRALREEGIMVENLCYLPCGNGQQAIGMTLWTMEKGGIPVAEVVDMLSVLLRRPLQISATSPYLVDKTSRSFLFVEEAKYIALTGFAKVVRENEMISGDSYAFLESERGKMTIMLSDGTGSGEKAGRDSGKVLDLMEKMLEAGYTTKSALHLVNSALYAKNEDGNHPTIDICNVDLHRGNCEFFKIGGAVSFLKRGDSAEVIEWNHLPLGIFQSIEAESVSKQLQDGDFIIMMSDGVLDAFGEEDYRERLLYTIEGMKEQNPGEFAEKLLHMAICACGGRIGDDMTVIVAGIWENSAIS